MTAAFVTLVATDSYVPGALVLAYSLKDVNSHHKSVCLVTPDISSHERANLDAAFDRVVEVPQINSDDEKNLNVLGRPELGLTFTKIHAWSLVDYSRACFLDADTLILRNVDELLDENGPYQPFAAAPDSGWPDCFNSGVFVYTPSMETFGELKRMAATEGGSFDGADQGLLNKYYSNWSRQGPEHRLPFIYNVTPSAVYSYAPAYKAMHEDIAIMHFIGTLKPWHWERTYDGGVMPKGMEYSDLLNHVQRWWSIHDIYVSKWNKSKGSFSKQIALEKGYANVPSHTNLHAQTDHAAPFFDPPTSSIDDFASYRVDWNMKELGSRPRSGKPAMPENPFAISSKQPMPGGEHDMKHDDEEDDRVPIKTKRRSAADLIPGPPGVSISNKVKAPTSGGATALPTATASKKKHFSK